MEAGGADIGDTLVGFAPVPEYDILAAWGSSSERITRELYGGYQRNTGLGGRYVAQSECYKKVNQILVYKGPGEHQSQYFYLHGAWVHGAE